MNDLERTIARDRQLFLAQRERTTHLEAIGQPGTGKTRALESWAMQDIKAGYGVVVLDPHGDLYANLLSRIAVLLLKKPALAERIILFDPDDSNWSIGFNPLEQIPGYSPARLAAFLTDVMIKIWRLDAAVAPRLARLLGFSFQALCELDLTLGDLPRFFYDQVWRDSLLQGLHDPDVAGYFQFEFPRSPGAIQQWATPVLNKVGALLFDPDMRLVFSTRSTINFRTILDHHLVLLVNLSKGLLGEANSALLGAFIVAHLQKAALSRADSADRSPCYVYLDEFQNYTTDNIEDILSESRKYGLSLILAHQYLDQLPSTLRSAVLNTTGTIACFRVGYDDARVLAHEIFPPGFGAVAHQSMKWLHLGPLSVPHIERDYDAPSQADQAWQLTRLKQREFWLKQRSAAAPLKLRTLDMPDPKLTEEIWQAREGLRALSGRLYGRRKEDLRKEVEHGRFRQYQTGAISDYEQG